MRASQGLAALTLVVAGCCATVPRAEKYFDRSSPRECVRMFRYAVDSKQYDAAYDCLVDGFRARYSERDFSLAVRYGRIDDLKIRELIVESAQDRREDSVPGLPPADARWVTLIYLVDPDDPATEVFAHSLLVVREDGEWRIDPEKVRQDYRDLFPEYSHGS